MTARWLAICLTCLLAPAIARAAEPASPLLGRLQVFGHLPAETVLAVATPDLAQLEAAWERTSYAAILRLPEMQPFLDRYETEVGPPWQPLTDISGLTWDDVREAASGEVALAWVRLADGQGSILLLADVSGRLETAGALVARATGNALVQPGRVYGAALPAGLRPAGRTRSLALTDRYLLACDDHGLAQSMLARLAGPPSGSLTARDEFAAALAQLAAAPAPAEAQVAIFVDVLAAAQVADAEALAKAKNVFEVARVKKKGQAVTLERHGLNAVQAVAGQIALAAAPHDVYTNLAIVAPPPRERVMRVLDLLPGDDFAPPAWLPEGMSTYITLYVDPLGAFEGFGTLFDDIFGDGEAGVFQDVVDSIRDDPDGPGVDLRGELLARLERRVHLTGDNVLPITPESERNILAIPTDSEQEVADVLRRLFEADSNAVRRVLREHEVWEVVSRAADEEQHLPNAALTVAQGCLLIATHVELLEKILAQPPRAVPDGELEDVFAELGTLTASPCLRIFASTADDYRVTYELLRMGRIAESESMYGQVYRSLVDDADDDEPAVDGALLPPFDVVAPLLHPAGITADRLPEGWNLTLFTRSASTMQAARRSSPDGSTAE